MTVWYKQGVFGDLSIPMQKAITRIASVYFEYYGEDLFVTSKRDGNHSPGSLHYNGNGLDFRYPGKEFDKARLKNQLRASLGYDFDVVPEATHVHVEFDPKERS